LVDGNFARIQYLERIHLVEAGAFGAAGSAGGCFTRTKTMWTLPNPFEWPSVRRFLSDRRGNIAVMFGIAMIPLTIVVGAAFDYTIAATDRTKLQRVNDEAIIAVARAIQANPSLTNAQQLAIVTGYLSSEVPMLSASVAGYSVDANGQITLDTTAEVVRTLSRVIPDPSGQYTIPIAAHSAAVATSPSLEVALVLDKTGSMAESAGGMSKIAALQQAANNLVTTLMTTSTTSVAVVPFSMSVNVGSSYNTAACGSPIMLTACSRAQSRPISRSSSR
jgi:Flp pilus assembly protein TadG